MNGSIAWHASPSSVTRPDDQRGSGGRSNSAQMNVSSTAPMIACTCGCQPSNAASASATSPRSVHDSRVQASWSKTATKLTSSLLLHEVVDEVRAGPHPDLRRHLELEVAQALGRDEAAIGGAAREAPAPRARTAPRGRRSGCRRPRRGRRRRRPRRSSNCTSTRSPWSSQALEAVPDVQALRAAGRRRAWPAGRRGGSGSAGSRRPRPSCRRAAPAAASARRPSGAGGRPAGARPCAPASSPRPSPCRTREAFGLTWMPAPTSLSRRARS